MTSPVTRQEAEEIWPTTPERARGAEARGRASSIPQPAVFPQDAPLSALTQSEIADRALLAADQVGGWLSSLAKGHHMTRHHPSLAATRERHHEVASEWEAWLVKGSHLAWAHVVHLPAKAVLMAVEWVLFSVTRTVTVIFTVVLTYYLCGGRF